MDSTRRIAVFTAFFVVLAILPAVTSAQGLTGAVSGTVKDSQGGVLAGAVVRLASASLMTGEVQTTSSEKGQWRFPVLPPGQYVLTVELSRFARYREEGLTIGAGASLERAVVLAVAGVADSVTVEASSSLTMRTTGLDARFGENVIRNFPSPRNSMFSVLNNAPGVSPTAPSSRTVNTISVFGSAVNENIFLIDGTNFTCPCQGVSRAEPIVDVIQEVHVQTMGASVEHGNMQGGVVNVVTRQGGARLAAETSYYAQSASLTAQPVIRAVTNGTQPTSGYERVRYRDFTTSVGGPVKRDRLWFFGAYQYLRDYDSQPGADPAFPRKYEQNKIFGKLNWRLAPSLQLMQSFHEEIWVNPPPPTLATPFIATQRQHASVPNMTFGHLTHVLSDRTVWEARVGRFTFDRDDDPNSGDRTTPPRRDQITGTLSGNAPSMGGLMLDRLTAKAVLHRFQPGWLGTDHEFRVGTQVERGEHRLRQIIPGGVQYVDSAGAPFQAIFRAPSIAGGVFITSALFASDSFTLRNRLTVDVGVRYDHSRAINPDLPVVDAEGQETTQFTPGRGTAYTWNAMSPRLGFNLKLDARSRSMLRASYGRFNQGVLTGELDPISPGITPTRTMAFDASTGDYTTLVSLVDPKLNVSLDPNTRTPHTDEFSLAFDRQISSRLRASAAYIRKRGSDFIGWTDTGGQYSPDTRTLADGTVVPVQVLTNGTGSRRFLLTNPDALFMHYDGVVIAAERRLMNGWQASGSYTYSRSHGMQVTSNAVAVEGQFSTIARPPFLTFGSDPNDLTNATGRLPNDRPHVFRATGLVHLPWRLVVAANLQHFTGRPWAETAQVGLPQGSQRIMLESRGTSHRLSSQSLFDLRISRTLTAGRAGTIDLMLDVLNLLNETAEEAIQSDNRFAGAAFGRATQFVDPRRAMVGIRVNFGR
jgi:hypothetical protein